ncbi:MAG: ADP-ribosylation factor family protein [Candidatus Hodarchaeales archaeon]|jgi:small GTP-binding protein
MFLRRLLRKEKEKDVQIAFVGLDAAGKTTCVHRLMKRNVEKTSRTMGLNTDEVKYRNLFFRIFDLGGQQTFRESIWETYVAVVDALIFVLDAADNRIDEAAEALWDVLETNQETPVLFLANKNDLSNARSFNSIIDDLDLSRASRSSRPFGLFKISALTGAGFYDAFDWLADTLKADNPFSSCAIHASVLIRITSGDFSLARFKPIPSNVINQFITDLDFLAESMRSYETGMETAIQDELQFVCVKRKSLACALLQRSDDSLTRSRLICERIIKQFENQHSSTENSELKEFVENCFPLDIAN